MERCADCAGFYIARVYCVCSVCDVRVMIINMPSTTEPRDSDCQPRKCPEKNTTTPPGRAPWVQTSIITATSERLPLRPRRHLGLENTYRGPCRHTRDTRTSHRAPPSNLVLLSHATADSQSARHSTGFELVGKSNRPSRRLSPAAVAPPPRAAVAPPPRAGCCHALARAGCDPCPSRRATSAPATMAGTALHWR